MNNFEKWEFEADIPMKDENGNWYDAETGIYFAEVKPQREDWATRQRLKKAQSLNKEEKKQEVAKQARIAKKRGDKEVLSADEYMSRYTEWCKENGIDMSNAASRGRAHGVFQKEQNVTS